ncbi:MAG TPA: MATE family efflux transporter [Spirochaetota bacterium]|nr:MATE family efflux transporter [Spirochaetota bacterium]
MERVKDLSEKSISSLMLRFYIPAFTGIIAGALYNIIDRILIGQSVGHLALSGLSVTFPVMIIIMGFGMLVGIGSGVLVSIELGKKNRERAEKVLGNGIFLMTVISLVLTVAGFITKGPVLHSFGATADTIEYADQFLTIILAGTIFGLIGNGFNSVIRAEGNANKAMVSTLISVGINVLLGVLFIVGLGLGVRGAAAATVIAQFVLAVYVMMHFTRGKSVIKLRAANLMPDPEILKHIISAGIAPFVMQIAGSVVQTLYNIQLIKHSGDTAVALMGIINSVAILLVMSIIALNMASQPILGYNYGAGNFSRVREAFILVLKYSTIISFAGFLISELFPAGIIKLFNSDPELLRIGVPGIRIFMAMMPLVGFQIVTSNFYQATGRAGVATAITLLRQVVILIPTLLFLPGVIGINGIWIASPVSDVLTGIFVFYLVIRGFRELDHNIERSLTA